ncbi:nucleoside-diphosphate kinase [Candidatus Fermentibacteria bacterium]|nr:nucleoside-diphosphate kinase [Candidatus Fermentibacteria bacterium]
MERTLVIIKPNGVRRGLVGDLLSRFERRGLKIAGLKMATMSRSKAAEHYAEHEGKSFYEELVGFITSGPVVLTVIEGPKAISIARSMAGPTDPSKASPGTIRGDYAISITCNIVHASDSSKSAEREIGLFFQQEEIQRYDLRNES